MRLASIVTALIVALAGASAPASLAQVNQPAGPTANPAAQDKSPAGKSAVPPAKEEVNPEVKKLARDLIEQTLRASRAEDIFADIRRTLRDVYIPTVRDMIEGDVPGLPAPDTKTANALAKILTAMDYTRKAGDELDVALSQNREAMISDAAGQIAKTATPVEIKDVQNILQLPAVRKGFDAFYSISKLLTGFSYQDSRTFSQFSAWANSLNLNFQQVIPGMPGTAQPAPSQHKLAKAQALIDDLLTISHMDEMVSDAKRFVRDVYVELAPMSEKERQDLREEADQWEFNYNLQKALVLAVAPSALAGALNDEQLNTVNTFVRSPAFAKAFDLLRNAVRAGTSFTKKDILGTQRAIEDLDAKSKLHERSSEEQDKARAEWDALVSKWSNIIENSISADTRSGLERSLKELQDQGSPI